jgi:hypothetical protein
METLSTAAPPDADPRRAAWTPEPWTLEQTLHVALAGVVIIGWTLVYMTLMRDIDRPQVARDAPARTAISANLPAR